MAPLKRKILFVQTQAENAGAQEIARLVGQGLAARGYDVHHLFFFRRTGGFDHQPNTSFCALERPSNPWAFFKFLVALYRHFRRIKPDVTLPLQHYGNIIGASVARLAGLKNIIANTTSAPATMNRPVRLADKLLGTIGVYDHIIVNSKDTESEYANWPQAYRQRMILIEHGFEDKSVNLSKYEARQALNLPQDVPLIGCVSRLHPLKNIPANIRLLVANPTWHYAHAGQGPELSGLMALAQAQDCADRVHFLGELPPAQIGVFLAGLDLLAFPSLTETFGLAPVEAAQAGVPVLANDIPVLREVLQTGRSPCAIFANAEDPTAFTTAAVRLLQDQGLRTSLVTASRQLQQRFGLTAMVDAYQQVIEAQLKT